LSAQGLLKTVRNEFEKISEHCSATINYNLPDVLMSALAFGRIKMPLIITI
jgi:uncharacterized protein involved in tolerance to divalent cations